MSGLPPLAEQKALVLEDHIILRKLTSEAFLEAWGPPDYQYHRHLQFYPVKNGNYVPQFRVPLGEAPLGWENSVVSDRGLFFGYPDRGEILGFIDDRLVYREKTSPEVVHTIGKVWQKNMLFRTTLEKGLPSIP